MHSLVIKTFSSSHRLHFFSRGYPLLLLFYQQIIKNGGYCFLSSIDYIFCYIYGTLLLHRNFIIHDQLQFLPSFSPSEMSLCTPSTFTPYLAQPGCRWSLVVLGSSPIVQRTPHVYKVTKYLCTSCPLAHQEFAACQKHEQRFLLLFNECFTQSSTNTTKTLRTRTTAC